MNETKKITLWEYDSPLILNDLLNYEAGIWFWTITPGVVVVTDDNGNTGYYDYTNSVIYNIQSLLIDGEPYSETTSLADCRLTNKSFYYDTATTYFYVHFDDFEPPLDKIVSVGAAIGFSYGAFTDGLPYYNNDYYEPRIKKIFPIKKDKDPLYYGLLKFITGKITASNNDGYFDDWKNRNLFAQATRLLIGNEGDDYSEFKRFFTGYIEDDSTEWTEFQVDLQDIRAGLTRPVASNLLTLADYPKLSDNNVDAPKPVAYGDIYDAPCICLNEEETVATYTFLLCDTEFNPVHSLSKVMVEGVDKTVNATLNASAGTFTLPTAHYNPGQEVTADFTVNIKNGVEIIKDLILNYDDKPFLASFWDLEETDLAEALSRNTSLYIDDDKKLRDAIESVSFDIDGLFFSKDDGVYTIRIYDEDREPVKIIKCDEFLGEPKNENSGSQYLTSAIIKYKHQINEDTYSQFENREYQDQAFSIYKRLKVETFETGLTTKEDAEKKSETILNFSANIPNIVTRNIKFDTDLEIMDFVICSPYTRLSQAPDYGVYEIIGIVKDLDKLENKLTLKYVKNYNLPVDTAFEILIDENGEYITDENGDTILMRG